MAFGQTGLDQILGNGTNPGAETITGDQGSGAPQAPLQQQAQASIPVTAPQGTTPAPPAPAAIPSNLQTAPPVSQNPQADALEAWIQQREARNEENRRVARQLLDKAMDPNGVLNYMPKQTATSMLQDALYNIAQRNMNTGAKPIQMQRLATALELHKQQQEDLLTAYKGMQASIGEENNTIGQMRQLAAMREATERANAANQTKINAAQINTLPKQQANLLRSWEDEVIKAPTAAEKAKLDRARTDYEKQRIADYGGNAMAWFLGQLGKEDPNHPGSWLLNNQGDINAIEHFIQTQKGLGIPTYQTHWTWMEGADGVKRPYMTTSYSIKGGPAGAPMVGPPAGGSVLPPAGGGVGGELPNATPSSLVTPPAPPVKLPVPGSGSYVPPVSRTALSHQLNAQELSQKSSDKLADLSRTRRQSAELEKWLEPHKDDNTPFAQTIDWLKYKAGMAPGLKSDSNIKNMEAYSLMAEEMLNQVQGAMPLMNGSRNITIYNDIKQHQPNPAIDGWKQLYDKLMVTQRNNWRSEAAIRQFGTKATSANPDLNPKAALPKEAADFYMRLHGWKGDPREAPVTVQQAAWNDAMADGWAAATRK